MAQSLTQWNKNGSTVSLKHRLFSLPIWSSTLIEKGYGHVCIFVLLCMRLQATSAMVHAAVFICGACSLQTQTFPKMPFLLENCLPLWVLWWNPPQIDHCPLPWRRRDKNRKMMFWEQENQRRQLPIFRLFWNIIFFRPQFLGQTRFELANESAGF